MPSNLNFNRKNEVIMSDVTDETRRLIDELAKAEYQRGYAQALADVQVKIASAEKKILESTAQLS